MKTSQKTKRYLFCYEGAVEGKNVGKSVKSQDFELEKILVKGSNMKNTA